jgi:hypothetical protein
MSIVGTISAENGTLTSTLSDSDLLNPTRNGRYSDDYQLTDVNIEQIITVELTSTEIDSYLQLIDADTGKIITEDDDSGSSRNSRLRFSALEGVNYIVRVSSYYSGATGTYQLATRSDAPPSPVGTISAANGSVTGSLSNEDSYDPTDYRNYYIDDYQLTDAIPGEVITLQMNAINLNGRIQLIDADTEKIIKEKYGDGQQTIDLSFVATEGINYKIRVSSASQEQIGSYQLSATSVVMDLADLAITDSSVPDEITLGKETEVTWTVANLGDTTTTVDSWYDGVYLSRNTTFEPEQDAYLNSIYNNNSLAVAESTTHTTNINISGWSLESSNVGSGSTSNPVEGDWYLLFVTDVDDNQLEKDETDNVKAVPIEITAPDLVITNIDAPVSIPVQTPTAISWTIENIGDGSAFGYWSHAIYLSDDEFYSSSDDLFLGGAERSNSELPLAAGDKYTVSSEINLLDDTLFGSKYLIFTVAYYDSLGEVNSDNNVYTVPIEITGLDANLGITATAPTTAIIGESIPTSWIVTNHGSETANSQWSDLIYLSDDQYFDNSDAYLDYLDHGSPLSAGESYTGNRNINIPGNTKVGSQYLLFISDYYDQQYETDETDNIKAVPIEITAPDLVISDATAPSNATLGESIPVSWKVTNPGNVSAQTNWDDVVYLSNDPILDNSDTFVAREFIDGQTPLKPGENYEVTKNITIPSTIPGKRYLLFVADRDNNQAETNETNNLEVLEINLNAPPIIGTISAANTSITGTLSTSDVKNPTSFGTGTYSDDYTIAEVTVDKPIILDLEASFNGYLQLINADTQQVIAQDDNSGTGSNSRITFTPTEGVNYIARVTSYYANATGSYALRATSDLPDLTISPQSVLNLAASGQIIPVSWKVTNSGSGSTKTNWYDAVYLSNDTTFDNSDTLVANQYIDTQTPLAANGDYTITRNIAIPSTATLGNRYLLFVTDYYDNAQVESNENNNVTAVPFEVLKSNLKVSATTSPVAAVVNDTVDVSWTVTNAGNGKTSAYQWYDYVYLSEDENYDAKDIQLKSSEKNNPNLEPGDSYTSNSNISIPNTKAGNYYLIFYTNKSDYYYYSEQESDRTDNFAAVPITLTVPDVDLTVTAAIAPSTALVHSSINVNYKVTNSGTAIAKADWYDGFYVSDDQYLDQNDTRIGSTSKDQNQIIEPGKSLTLSRQITIPNVRSGSRYLLFAADYNNRQGESNDTNNVYALPIEIKAPNLIVSNATAPTRVNKGSKVNLSWTVENKGNLPAKADFWYDHVYLSEDPILDQNDRSLTSYERNHYNYYAPTKELASQEKYSIGLEITIPKTNKGNYYLLFVADKYNYQGETDETDNITALPLEILDPTNIKVTAATAPSEATLDDKVQVSWTISNTGTETASGNWYNYVYLSKDSTFDSSDVYVSGYRHNHNTLIEPGGSYTVTQEVSIPKRLGTGESYLLFVTDQANDFPETDETDNVFSLPISLSNAANLKVTNATSLATASFYETLNLSWTVTNTGVGRAASYWNDEIYISEDEKYDSTDTYIDSLWHDGKIPLNSNASYQGSKSVTIPKSVKFGKQYILFVTDKNNYQAESDETDNVLAMPLEIKAADLTITNTTVPQTVTLNNDFDISWTVANIGEGTAINSINSGVDSVYLSKDAIFDNNDKPLLNQNYGYGSTQTIGKGASYTFNNKIKISNSVQGDYYLLFVSDQGNIHKELDETNNVAAVPIKIKAPNLKVTNATAPVTATTSGLLNISMTVTNTGDGAIFTDRNGWYDQVYISDDQVFDSSDRSLLTYSANRNLNLAPGESYTLPLSAQILHRYIGNRIGNQYLLFVADADNKRTELDETDNFTAVPIEIKAPNLTVSNVVSPKWAAIGQTIPVSWTVTNNGEVSTVPHAYGDYSYYGGGYEDYIYISTDTQLDSNDIYVSETEVSQKHPLAVGSSYTISQNITLPNSREGELYLLFATDRLDRQGETDETDNVKAIPLTISENGANLKVTAATAPATTILGQQVAVNWTTTNTGGVAASLDWVDRVYLSDNSTLESTDTLLTEQARGSQTPLAAGASYNLAKNIDIPLKGAGSRYLLFVADGNNAQIETNETDNVYALPIELKAPNLTITAPVSPATAYLGESIELGWTVGNRGEVTALGNWSDTVYISDDRYLGEKDVYLTSRHRSSALAAGSEYSITQNITIPRTEIGDRYLLFIADSSNTQGENSEIDNLVAVPFKLTAKDVDLVVSDIIAPLESFAGEEVEIVWTVTNNGSDQAKGSWTDEIYLASDPENPTTYQSYGSFNFTGTVAGGKSIERRQKITLPQTLQGKFSVVVKTDTANSLIEYGQEDNNTTIKESQFTSILPTFPNLQVTKVTAPTTAFSSQKTLVEWTVANTGNGATSAPIWYDTVWLSLDQNFDSSDLKLGKVTNSSYLNVGESYRNSLEVDLPQGIDGNYYFLVQTDGEQNQVFEYQNENDNLGVSKIADIELTPPPDLQVTVNAPNNAFSGQYTSLSWTVTNEGQGRTLQSSWYDEVYLSTDQVLDGSDKSLGRQNHSGILEPGASYTVSNTTRVFKLPEGISGDYYFLVRTDAGKQVYESALAANNTSFDPTPTKVFLTPPPDLEISVDAPNTALASHNLTVNYRLSNYGATATPYGRWTNAFYLSVDDRLDSSDLLLDGRTFTGSLDLGEDRNQSVTLTLPNGISGQYYLFAKADSNDEVFELDNNNNIAFDRITIASQPADLVVSEVTAPELAEAGTGMQISWTVINQGTGDTVKTNWNDQLLLSVDSVIGNSDDRILKTFTHNGLLKAGESYSNNELITVPFDLQGNYQLYIQTDVSNSVYEANNEVNNTSVLSPLAITRKTPDLQVTVVNAPLTGVSGESLVVDWSVANLGTGKTNSNYWYDEVFLSLDRDLGDSNDISLGKVYHSGSLDPNGKYDASHNFKLPQNLNKNYYVIVRTDTNYYRGESTEGRVLETPLENNNETAATSKTSISLNTVPDLVIEQIDAPAEAISGQSFNLNWTVTNQGAEANHSWHDVFYLSRDRVFDRSSDTYLGSSFHYGKLAAGAETSKTASFNIPRGLSGPFYVFAVTDNGNEIYERDGEANNIAYDGNSTNVILPPPADLGNGNINLTDKTVTAGDFISLGYTVESLVANLPSGTWTDSIYLSADDRWDINDLLLTKVKTSAVTIVNGNYTRNVNTKLPGVVPGDYHLIVRSDIFDEISESNENNNLTVSAETVNVDIPSLEIDTAINGTLNQGQEAYYRVDVPSGETLQFVLDSVSNNAVNELYVSYGKMPTRADFDFGFEEIAADQDILVPLSEAGTYYILARGQYVPGVTPDYSLAVNTIDFGITDIETKVGDKGGAITFAIEGAKFNSNLAAALENDAGEVIEATNIWYEDSTKVFATFDLSKAAIGNYNLKVSQPSIQADFVKNEAGEDIPVLKETTLENVVQDGFKVVSAKEDDLLVTVTSTPRVSPGQYFDIVLNYANNGTHDLEAPLLHLEANQDIGFANIQDGDEFVGNNSLTLLGISNEGAAGILRPGEIGTVRLRGRAVREGSINITASQVIDDGTPLDYEQFINDIGGDIEDPAWLNAAKALSEKFGTSWSSFASGLATLATENSALGKYSHSVSELWTDVALDAWGDEVSNNNSLEKETISNSASNNLVIDSFKNTSNPLNVQLQSENISTARLASFETENNPDSTNSLSESLEDDFTSDKKINSETEIELLADISSLEVQSQLKLVDTSNPLEVQSQLELAEQIIKKSADVIQNEYGATIAAEALKTFVGEDGLENPPSVFYEQKLITDLGLDPEKTLFDAYSNYINQEIKDWTSNSAVIDYASPGGISRKERSHYEYASPYETTFHGNLSIISDAVKNSSSYQSKVKNNKKIEKYLENEITKNKYKGANDLSSDPIYIGNKNLNRVFGDSNDFNYFDQKILGFATYEVIDNYYKLVKLKDSSDGNPNSETYQKYQNDLNASIQNLQNLHNEYFGTTESAELAFLMGRTAVENRWARVNSINIDKGDCASPLVSYTANIDFFLLDGTTFNSDDAPKDEYSRLASLLKPGLGLLNFLINPFSGEDSINRENINNLLKIGPALGLGWDVQQFGYGQPHYNLVKVEDTIQGLTRNPDYDRNCQGPPYVTPKLQKDSTTTASIVSRDPNDILGPEGFGEQQWINGNNPLGYTIRFENDPKLASAPAQVVRITQQLDSDLDFRTFRVGDFGFGDTFIDVPNNRAFYQTRLDLVAEKGIYVDVFAGIDIAKGEAFWELRSIDPATGEQPSDPLLGFLPPNLTKPEGDGFVSYTINPDRNIATGTVIDAEATIVFDINEPIDTPAILNTIDAGKPTSTVNSLPQISQSPEFAVSWSGSDDANGSAIADYTIYVAKDGGEYSPWLANTTLTEATFTGTTGSSYEFYAVARDNAGNVQDLTTTAQAVIAIAGGNNPPVLVNPIGTQTAAEDSNFSLTITEDIFIDNDEGEVLTYTATLSNGSDLPNWLIFDVETRTFSGTPSNEDLGNLNIIVTVTDKEGETVSDTFELKVLNVNDTPTLDRAIANQVATEDEAFSFTFSESTFSDVDAGDSLTYTATLANGNELPSWLTFEAETRTFSGTSLNRDVANLSIKVTATDNDRESVSNIFELEVVNVNDAPTLKTAIANQVVIEDEIFSFTFPVNIFSDVDAGDSLTYTATNADGSELPNWLTFDAATRTFSGTPLNRDVGNLSIKVTATDNNGETAADIFELEVVNVNDTPTIETAIANQTTTEDEEFNFTLAENIFNDVDAKDRLTYSATNADGSELPSWLTFNKETRTLSGTPINEDVGTLNIRVTAIDNQGVSVSDTFELEVVNVNDAPTLKTAIANQTATEDLKLNLIFPADTFNDVDTGDSLTYSATNANGSALPTWLTFNSETRSFSGTPVNENVGQLNLKLTATDKNGEKATDTFNLEVVNVNDAPTLKTAIANQIVTEDQTFSFTFPEDTFKDIDAGDSLAYSAKLADGGELPSWLSFDAQTRTFSGNPVNEDVDNLSIKVTATDKEGELVSNTFELGVVNTNDAPTLKTAITLQTATEDKAFSFTFPENTFNDVDFGDSLTYTATNADGNALPSWLSFDANTRTFSGIPVNENVGNLSLQVTATDHDGESASDTFNLEVVNVNDAPTLKTAIANQVATEDKAFSFTFSANTFNDVDAKDRLTYTATLANGNELPSWLTFNAETRTFSGTPVNENVGNLNLRVTATDNSGESVNNIFELEVANVNDAPTLDHAIANQTATEDLKFNFIFPANTFNDVDTGDNLTYSATLSNGSALPTWLTFNAETRTFSGTPVNENVGKLNLKLTATDKNGEAAPNTFDLEVINVNDTPLNINLSNSSINENSSNGTIIGNLSTLDPDIGDTHSYTLINNAGGRFTLDGNKLLVAQGNRLDFETNKNHLIEVKATDRAGLSLTKNLTINLNDLNEPPVLTDDSITANSSSAKVIANSYLLSNDRDPESQPLSLIGVSNVNGGTVSRQQNTVSFTPATNFNGTAYFQYTASDGVNSSTATVKVEVGVTQNGSNKDDQWTGTKGDDLYQGLNGNDLLSGEAGDDLLSGDNGNDTLTGGLGNDTLSGNNGNDELTGDVGDDVISGDNGNDTLTGGLGNDTINGGKGNDLLLFNSFNQGVDTIADFSVKEDTLVFSAAGFGGNLVAGKVSSQMFTLGTAATSSSHRFIYNVGSGDLFYDSDGIGGNEQIKLARLDSGLSLGSDNLFVG